ncbi:DUF6597 domain-containing transcriptional factor [Myxococcus xanthus]|uniref:DUF6597 domain-containing transcriptional factor n=1 Tax=Myxococcus xanthus TaxID=34 RepID=UPI001F28118E|nr:DUF6597 domain-containing transcriptional factor [Myxococcus xanthus]
MESLWTYDGQFAHGFERVLPSGRMQLLVNLHEDAFRDYRLDGRLAHKTRGVAIQGAHTAPRVVDTACQRSICGVSFAPASASPFLGMPASELTGKVVDLYEIWGRDGTILRERLLQAPTSAVRLDVLEAALLARGRASKPRDEAVAVACSLLMGGASVRAVGVRLGLSPRRLIERFQVHVGVKPKLFARIARFQSVLESAGGEKTWATLAGEHGFRTRHIWSASSGHSREPLPSRIALGRVRTATTYLSTSGNFLQYEAGRPGAHCANVPKRNPDRSPTTSP